MPYLILILKLLLIGLSGFILYRAFLHVMVRLREKQVLTEQHFILIRETGKWTIVILVILLIFQQLGIEATHILAVLSGVLVLIALGFVAVWSVLSNILCAFLLLLFPPFRFGDEIEIKDPEKEKGIKGKVTGLNVFFTSLKTNDDQSGDGILIRVPNTMFFQRVIVCYEGADTQDLKLKPVQRGDQEKENVQD